MTVVITDPRNDEQRRAKEAAIRFIDMFIYVAVFCGGVFALFFTPDSVTVELKGFEWLVVLWAALLMVGGSLGFVGRLSRFWVIELPGTSAGIFGAAIYAVVLGKASLSSTTALVAVTLVVIAAAALFKRYTELHIFTSEPGARTFAERLRLALRRRTVDSPTYTKR